MSGDLEGWALFNAALADAGSPFRVISGHRELSALLLNKSWGSAAKTDLKLNSNLGFERREMDALAWVARKERDAIFTQRNALDINSVKSPQACAI